MAEVDCQSWPARLAVSCEVFRARIAAFPDGQLVAEIGSRVVATAAAQRIDEEFLQANGHSYELLTDRNRLTTSHEPFGEIFQLIGVGVLPDLRGENLGRLLVDRQIELAREQPDIRRIIGFTRPAHYRRYSSMPIEAYVRQHGDDGRPLDPVLAFHLEAGARVVAIQAGFRPDDIEACGYGVLIEYPRRAER